jgi:uncharacterized protein
MSGDTPDVVRKAARTVLLPVWNRTERRPRAPFRVVLTLLLIGVCTLFSTALVGVLGVRSVLVASLAPTATGAAGSLVRALSLSLMAIATVVGIWASARLLDRRPFRTFGFALDRNWWLDLGFGLALGAGLMIAIVLVERAAGWVTVSGTVGALLASGPTVLTGAGVRLLAALCLFVAVGIYEELLFRGYLLRNLAEGLSGIRFVTARRATALATFLTAVVFGTAHAMNPNATVVSTIAITFAGVFLAVGYLLTGELAIPIGVHITWNLFQGTVLGFPVSGTDFGTSVIGVEGTGPTAITGGPFGPEAGFVGFAAMLAGTVLTVLWVRLRYGHSGLATSITDPTLRWR